MKLFMQAWNNLDEAKRDSVTKQYMAEEQKRRSYDSARKVAAEEVAAAKKWLQEYKKIFDRVAARNAGMNVVEDVTTVEIKEEIKRIGKLVDELGGTATQVPKKVIKKIGKIVPENEKTASGTKVQDSGERFAIDIFESMSEEYQDKGNEIADFIDGVNNMIDETKKSKRKKKIGVLSDSHVKIINDIVRELYPEFSAEGYELWIDGTGAQHIERRHGQNGEADSTMASREEKSLIPWAAQNAESGGFIRESDGSVRHSTRFFNKDGSRAPEIRLEKKTSDGVVFISECVPDSVNKRIWITSAYRNKKSSKGQLLNIEDTSSPQPTPEASFDSNATKTIIHKSDEKINTSGKNSSNDFDLSERSALADGKRATAGEVAAVKSAISKRGIDPKGIIAIADRYFARYSGQLTRTESQYIKIFNG